MTCQGLVIGSTRRGVRPLPMNHCPPGSLALDSKVVESAAASSRSRDSRIGIARSPADSDELLPIPKGSVRIVRNPFDVAGFLGTPKHPVGFSKAPKYP